jgi:hypothetical protein
MNRKSAFTLIIAFALQCAAGVARAELSAEQIARLGGDLTPLGGERAGNSDGTIPPWEGGITAPPPGYVPGQHHPDPYADDAVLFTIDASNMDLYRDRLTVGEQAMLKTYEDFYLNIYPTRRSGSAPQRIYDATAKAAATAKLTDGGNGVSGAVIGIPFPIPANGQEAIWNHILRYRGNTVARWISQAAPTRGGSYTLVEFADELDLLYAHQDMTEAKLNNTILMYKQKVLAPARLAGNILLVQETLDQVKENRRAWIYNIGQRRVRRAPNIAYDNPGVGSDGLRTNDQFDMFNGAIDRYDWKLIGKREMYVPYNAYKLHSDKLKYSDILIPQHINAKYPRYELHRVWVVDATLKKGMRHIYKRRTFYLDEDSWQILSVDIYDNRDQLWRVSEGHVINYYEVPVIWTTLEVTTDLQAGRYLALGLDNESRGYDFNIKRSLEDYTPAALRREGRR